MAEEGKETLNLQVFLQLLRHILQDEPESYERYLKIMKDFKAGGISIPTLSNMMCDLFKGNPVLILAFNKLLPASYQINLPSTDELAHNRQNHLSMYAGFEEIIKFTENLKAKFLEHDSEVYTSFQTILHQYGQGDKSIDDINNEVLELFKDHPDLQTKFIRIRRMIPGKKSCDEDEEDFKLRIHSKDEKTRFKIEDDMFEFDVYLERLKSTINNVQELLERIENNEIIIDDTSFQLEDHLSTIDLRCIERLYDEQGLELLDRLNDNCLHLKIVLKRLNEKYAETILRRTNFMNKCRKIIDRNKKVHKSRAAAIPIEENNSNAIVFEDNNTTIPHKLFQFI